MKVMLFGATGMVGQGVLRECLLAPDVEQVLVVGRQSTGESHAKLREIVQADLFDLSAIEHQLVGYDACLYCVGVTSAGMNERDYRRLTYDLALAVAQTLIEVQPGMVFVFVSGAGADPTGQGRLMWARVKGQTENALSALPFKAVYVVRPGYIQPRHGIRSKTRWYRLMYDAVRPLYPVLRALLPHYVTTTEQLGRALLAVARHGAPTRVIEGRDINAL